MTGVLTKRVNLDTDTHGKNKNAVSTGVVHLHDKKQHQRLSANHSRREAWSKSFPGAFRGGLALPTP